CKFLAGKALVVSQQHVISIVVLQLPQAKAQGFQLGKIYMLGILAAEPEDLFLITRLIDIIRATRPEKTIDEPGDEEEIFRLGGQDAEHVDLAELESLRFCLGEMKDDDRNYVLLAYYEGFSREELAERFEAPVGTIKTRLRRGLLALRSCLERA
ncbi:MAG: sigma factor-like helix-turn-helix DNA-binding protein, partial [Pseudomonadota bacterium]